MKKECVFFKKQSAAMLSVMLLLGLFTLTVAAQRNVTIQVESKTPDRILNPMIYGQLFEHIYFSPSNGVWNEIIYQRSFEPEHYPGIKPRDGYFDGWYADDEKVLHSPTRYEQPVPVTTIENADYELSMEVNWRSYKLARRSWSGGALDIRFAFKNSDNGEPYVFRIFDPQYERAGMISGLPGAPGSQERQLAENQMNMPSFSITKQVETQVAGRDGQMRTVKSWSPIKLVKAQLDTGGTWHSLRIKVNGKTVRVYWDNKQILNAGGLDATSVNDIVFWVNYTETYYKNIKITSGNGRTVYYEGMPEVVSVPAVAHQWNSFGDGVFSLAKDDAVNMRYSQVITSRNGKSGVFQGPKHIMGGEKYFGSIYAKGDGQGYLSVAFKSGERLLSEKMLGKPGTAWTKYDFILDAGAYSGDADFAICVNNGRVQVDQVSMSSQTGIASGGFRPDILKVVKDLAPTNLRWPGGGYAAQYQWKWGVGPQEKRERWAHWQWLDYDQNAFGTDEFIRFCREVKAEPVIVVRIGYERPESEYGQILQDACDWVAYCNEPATGKWGSIRAANGHPEPYNVKYWEIDNEMWEFGLEKYEAAVRRFSTAMREVDPSIKIVVCGGYPQGQDEGFLMRSGQYFDYMSLHHYEGANGYAAGPERLRQRYTPYADLIAKCPNPNIKLYISEWNLHSIDWRTGLFAGGFLNMCEQTPVIEWGAAALFIRRTDADDWNNAFINFDYKDVFVAPNYQVTKLWYDNFSRYNLRYTGDTGELSVQTTLAENGSAVIVKIVNPTETSYTLTINGDWAGIAGADYNYYAPGNLMTANSMEDKNAVALKNKNIVPHNNAIILSVEPLSAGVLNIKNI